MATSCIVSFPMATRTKGRGAKGRSKARKSKRIPIRTRLAHALRKSRERIRERLGRQTDDVWGLILIVAALLVTLSFFGLSGPVGAGVSGAAVFLFGTWAYAVPLVLAVVGVTLVGIFPRLEVGRVVIGVVVVFLSTLSMFHLLTGSVALAGNVDQIQDSGGVVGALIAFPLRRLIGFWGAFLVLLAVIAAGTLVLTRSTVRDIGHTVVGLLGRFRSWVGLDSPREQPTIHVNQEPVITETPAAEPTAPRKGPNADKSSPKKAKPKQPAPPRPTGEYALPPLSLLNSSAAVGANKRGLEQTASELEASLREHGVDAKLTRIVPGPTVTRYEIELAAGVKVERVTSLAHDIAYALA